MLVGQGDLLGHGLLGALDDGIGTGLELAGQLYSQGVAVMTTNLPKSVELLTEAVSLDPDNWRYKQSLNQASKMQQNLGRINTKPKN